MMDGPKSSGRFVDALMKSNEYMWFQLWNDDTNMLDAALAPLHISKGRFSCTPEFERVDMLLVFVLLPAVADFRSFQYECDGIYTGACFALSGCERDRNVRIMCPSTFRKRFFFSQQIVVIGIAKAFVDGVVLFSRISVHLNCSAMHMANSVSSIHYHRIRLIEFKRH